MTALGALAVGFVVLGIAGSVVLIGWLIFENEMGKPRPDPTLIDRIQRLFGDRK